MNNKLFIFRKKNTPLCSFCNKEEETPLHLFSEYTYVIYLWQQLAIFFKNNLILPALIPQTVLLGLRSDNANHDEPIINPFLPIFKLYVYNPREKHRLNIMDLLTDIKEKKKRQNTVYLPTVETKERCIMRNYQLRKANNEVTLMKKIFFLCK